MKKSTGFSSGGFQQTLSKELAQPTSPLARTIKSASFDRREERKTLIQNFLEQNAQIDQPLRKESIQNTPFNQRIHQKFMSIVDEPAPKQVDLPGVLQVKKFNFGNVFEIKPNKEPIVLVQSLVRRFIAKRQVNKKRKYYQNLIDQNAKASLLDQMIRDDINSGEMIINKLQKLKKQDKKIETGGLDRNNPFYTCMLEIMGEKGYNQVDYITHAPTAEPIPMIPTKAAAPVARLRPKTMEQVRVKPKVLEFKLPDDGCGAMKAFYMKKYHRQPYEVEVDVRLTNDYIEKQAKLEKAMDSKDKARMSKIKGILAKEMPKDAIKPIKTLKKKKSMTISEESQIQDEIEDEIIDEQSIQEASSIQEYLDDGFEDQSDSQIKEESIQESSQYQSQIKESLPSVGQRNRIKESIQDDIYEEDFEDQSGSIKEQVQYDDEFESYHSESKVKPETPPPIPGVIVPFAPVSIVPTPKDYVEVINTEPLPVDGGWSTKRAKLEADILLKNYTEKYKSLREVELNEDDFEPLKQEYRDLKRIEQQVGNLVKHTGDFYQGKDWMPKEQGNADTLYAKFQYEFNRLLSMNSLGTRFSKILGTTLFQGTPKLENAAMQSILSNIEQQQQIIQQVLQSVQLQMSHWFENQQNLQELKQYRQDMDQKLQWMLFKQDKIINNQLTKQLADRDRELRKFISDQFDKHKKVQIVDPQLLKDALLKNQGHIPQYKFEQSAQSKKDSSMRKSVREESYQSYQPDFEDEQSERIATEKSEPPIQVFVDDNSITVDKEVFDVSQQSEIEWQNDINLFNKSMIESMGQEDMDVQNIVDYLADLLLKEIQQDLYPIRKEQTILDISAQPIQSSLQTSQVSHESISEEDSIDQPVVVEQPALIRLQPKQKPQQVEIDDFGMGGPSFNREELSQEISNSDGKVDEDKKIDLQLVVDDKYQQFVTEICTKYGKVLTSKQKIVVQKFKQILDSYKKQKQETLGSLLIQQFKFLKPNEVTENNAYPIVQALEEQLCQAILAVHNDHSDKYSIAEINKQYQHCITQAKQTVLKITESRIPVDVMNGQQFKDYTTTKKYSDRQVPMKECPQQLELQDRYLQDELYTMGDQAQQYILKQILSETLEQFNTVALKRQKNK